jgi:hypothetical protein
MLRSRIDVTVGVVVAEIPGRSGSDQAAKSILRELAHGAARATHCPGLNKGLPPAAKLLMRESVAARGRRGARPANFGERNA